MTLPSTHPPRTELWVRRFTLLVTNIVKLAGVFLAVRATFTPPIDPIVMVVASFMMAGAEASEAAIMKAVRGFFSAPEEKHEEPRK